MNVGLLGHYLVYPPFTFQMLGIDFTNLCTTSISMLFYSSCNFFQRSSLLSGGNFTKLEAHVHFDGIYVKILWTPWQQCDYTIVEPFDCWCVGMFWAHHKHICLGMVWYMSSQLMQSKTMMSLPSCFTLLLTTQLLRGFTNTTLDHCTQQCWICFHVRIWLSYTTPPSQSLCSFSHSCLNCLWWSARRGLRFLIAYCSPRQVSALLTLLGRSSYIWNLL